FARGGAHVTLTEIPGGTRLSYDVEASVGGKLAQLGSRLIDGFARKMADEFFERFQQTVEGPAETPEGTAQAVTPGGEGNDPGGGEKKKGWLKRLIG
ncbi:MAG: SRPBCC domain-containing protein, partial [Cereibacter sp.]